MKSINRTKSWISSAIGVSHGVLEVVRSALASLVGAQLQGPAAPGLGAPLIHTKRFADGFLLEIPPSDGFWLNLDPGWWYIKGGDSVLDVTGARRGQHADDHSRELSDYEWWYSVVDGAQSLYPSTILFYVPRGHDLFVWNPGIEDQVKARVWRYDPLDFLASGRPISNVLKEGSE